MFDIQTHIVIPHLSCSFDKGSSFLQALYPRRRQSLANLSKPGQQALNPELHPDCDAGPRPAQALAVSTA